MKRVHPNIAGTVEAYWVRLPLHVGVMIESSNLGLLVQHNEGLFVIDNGNLQEIRTAWVMARPSFDVDPAAADAVALKFLEDIAASGFSSDLDMPVSSIPVLGAGEPATIETIWNSYQRKVVPSQLFSGLVGSPNAPQYQFDNRYLKLSEVEREWFNEVVLPFWNKDCNAVWENAKKILTDPTINNRPAELAKRKQPYTDELEMAMDRVLKNYLEKILPLKQKLSADLRADPKLLLPGVRIVASKRIGTVLPSVRRIREHIAEISDAQFKFPPGFVPPFARPDEKLLELP
jgi:hypothetical protein